MKIAVAFLLGAIVGAGAVVFLLRQPETSLFEESVVVGPPRSPEEPLAAAPVGVPPAPAGQEIEEAEEEGSPAAPPIAPSQPEGVADVAIPVLGVTRDQLRDHFNDPRGGRPHRAIDIAAPRGTPVIAAIDGTVLKLFLSRAGGITIYQLDPEQKLVYYYAHLDSYAPAIAEGRMLKRGEVIGFVGTTGNAPPGAPHLHFAIEKLANPKEWWKGEPINPYPILVSRGVTWQTAAP